MTQTVIRKSKWFWPWQDAQEEAWLEQMSLQGMHLQQMHPLAQYTFTRGEPTPFAYRLDFQDSLKPKTKEEYLQLFADAGWEHLGEKSGWQYFRKPLQPGENTEVFTDAQSKIQKYNRFLTWFGLAFPSYLVVFVALWGSWPEWMMWLNAGVILALTVMWAVVALKVSQRITELKAL